LAAVTAPRFFSPSDLNAQLFLDDTVAAVRYAQKLAVGTGCEVQVTISSNTYTLNLQNGCSGSTYTQAVIHPGTGDSGYSNTAPAGVSLNSDVSPFIFDALGRAKNTLGTVTDVTVTVGTLQIDIVGESGFVDAS
jgi:MSHA pilin protein MshC